MPDFPQQELCGHFQLEYKAQDRHNRGGVMVDGLVIAVTVGSVSIALARGGCTLLPEPEKADSLGGPSECTRKGPQNGGLENKHQKVMFTR